MITADSARRRYVAISFLTWLPVGLYLAPMVLLMLERGLSLGEVATIGAVYSVAIVVLELPTGGLSDVLGRRPVLLASAVTGLGGLLLLGLGGSLWPLAASALLRGVARALSSGPAEAWYVDAVHAAAGRDADLAPGLARGGMAASAAMAVGVLAGGTIPFLWPAGPGADVPGLAVPVLLAVVCQLALLVVVAVAMREPRAVRPGLGEVLRGVPDTVAAGLRLAGRDHVLVRLLFMSAVSGVALAVIELLTPAWMAVLAGGPGGGVLAYALVAAVGFAAGTAGNALSAPLTRWLGSPGRAVAVCLLAAALALAGLAGTASLSGVTGVVAAGTAYLLMFVGLGAMVAPVGQLLHDRVGAGERSTVLSVDSLVLQLGAGAGSPALGWLATARGPGAAFAVSALLLCPAALLLWHVPRRIRAGRLALVLRHGRPHLPARDRPREDRVPRP
ncbi:hypothetical protein CS0771_27730 [Catellatospora sp. IY07-71]|uniref:MFS transporter n=1 Tax=Catellatospora sp. IY07-71 TaxID=2728827 RepID=UPI001BB803FB|nr:MFS transporter [Catellatospora sp. IY07-71]BCJ73229.1 hypothetical protein CS0771_27730 [Catellatospora sp. IY07-71]